MTENLVERRFSRSAGRNHRLEILPLRPRIPLKRRDRLMRGGVLLDFKFDDPNNDGGKADGGAIKPILRVFATKGIDYKEPKAEKNERVFFAATQHEEKQKRKYSFFTAVEKEHGPWQESG